MKEKYFFTILSEDKRGLISIITQIFNRANIQLLGINGAMIDNNTDVLITIEALILKSEVNGVKFKIRKLIEVISVESHLIADILYQKIGIYTIDVKGYNFETFQALQKYGAQIIGIQNNSVIILKSGREEDIRTLYNSIDGPYLKHFQQSGALVLNVPYTGSKTAA